MKKAFTLIELLVVIAIISLLAAIIFPVFARAKAAAQSSATLSNLKQLGTAAQLYLADYDDSYMGAVDGFGGEGKEGGWMYYTVFANYQPGKFEPEKGGLYPYVKSVKIFRAEGVPGPDSKVSFAINGCLSEPTDSIGFNKGRSASVVPDPARSMVFGEEGINLNQGGSYHGATNDAYFNVQVDVFSAWHNGKSNMVFADTHAKSLDAQAQFEEVLFGGQDRCP